MADFVVNSNCLKMAADELEKTSGQILRISDDVRSVLSGTRRSITIRIAQSLQRAVVCSNIANCSNDCKNLSKGLDKAAKIYERYEKSIADKDISMDIGDGFSIRDTFKNIFNVINVVNVFSPAFVSLVGPMALPGVMSGALWSLFALKGYDIKQSDFLKNLLENGKVSGSLLSGSISKQGEFLGVETGGELSGELIGGSVTAGGKAKWDLKKGEVGIEGKVGAEGHLATGTAKGNFGVASGEISGTVGKASATGAVGATLFKDKKFSPGVYAKAEAKAVVAEGEAKGQIGSDAYNVHGKAEGSVLGAKAEAKVGFGEIEYVHEKGVADTKYGFEAKAAAEAYLAEGKLSGGFTIFGIEIDASVKGKAGGAGLSGGVSATSDSVSGSLGAGLGLGLGLEISIDWSGFKLF